MQPDHTPITKRYAWYCRINDDSAYTGLADDPQRAIDKATVEFVDYIDADGGYRNGDTVQAELIADVVICEGVGVSEQCPCGRDHIDEYDNPCWEIVEHGARRSLTLVVVGLPDDCWLDVVEATDAT